MIDGQVWWLKPKLLFGVTPPTHPQREFWILRIKTYACMVEVINWGTSPAGLSDEWMGYSLLGSLVNLGNEFTDVSLASEDGQLVEAHKVILACCSPKSIHKNRNTHPPISGQSRSSHHCRISNESPTEVLILGPKNSLTRELKRCWRAGA